MGQRAILKAVRRQQTGINLSTFCKLSGLLCEGVSRRHQSGPQVDTAALDLSVCLSVLPGRPIACQNSVQPNVPKGRAHGGSSKEEREL